jgi:predicted nucleic acid-binding protein
LKVLVDSNVIISALLWPNSNPANALGALNIFIDDLEFIKIPEVVLGIKNR